MSRSTIYNSFFLLFILVMISGCSKSNDIFLVENIKSAFPDNVLVEQIYHLEVIKPGLLVFYKSGEGLGAGILKPKSGKWEWVTNAGYPSLIPDEGLSVIFSNRFFKDKEILYFSYGAITNPDIIEVKSLSSGETRNAKIIQTPEGDRIWFVTYEEIIDELPDIIGLSKEGELLINTNQ